jgi:hypothetical protein
MSVQYDAARCKFVVRCREDGKQRVRRLASAAEAATFDSSVNPNGRANEHVERVRKRRSDASRASRDRIAAPPERRLRDGFVPRDRRRS